MSGFNWKSQGGEMSKTLHALATEREAKRRQDMIDQIAEQQRQFTNKLALDREARLTESDRLGNELSLAQLASIGEQRKAAAANQAETMKTTQIDRASKLNRPGDYQEALPGDAGDVLFDKQATLPSRSSVGGMTAPSVAPDADAKTPFMMPGKTTSREAAYGYKGTAAQRDKVELDQKRTALETDPLVPEAARAAIRAGVAPNASMFENQDKPVVLKRRDNSLAVFDNGAWKPLTSAVPKNAQIINENDPNAGEGSDRPYVITQATANGLFVLNGRTGAIISRYDLRPGEGAQDDIVRGQAVAHQLSEINKFFDPRFVGPIAGRYKTAEAMLAGVESEPRLAQFQTSVAALQNMVINLRTGAAMSEPEAIRILGEVPNVNLPPSTFLARLEKVTNDYNMWLRDRSKLAFGRVSKGDVDTWTGGSRPEMDPATMPGGASNGGTAAETPQQKAARIAASLKRK